jgi:NADH-quinone oxidoreductase subunit L
LPVLAAQPLHYTQATGTLSWLPWVLIALPLFSAVVLLFGGKRTNKWGHLLGCFTVVASFVLALIVFFLLKGKPNEARQVTSTLFHWTPVGGFQADAGILVDPLSLVFMLLITGVGALIHIFSIAYMEHDPRRRLFFGYLNFFVVVMLLLVMADNYLLMYVGWEGVGLASYLLIAFWVDRPTAATAAKKAFLENRVGDVGLSLAIMLMFATFGRVDFAHVFGGAPTMAKGTAAALGLLLLLGACAKSGQFPLHTWLPDAMEGPTPVSALIHAATMVTAGVYLIVRSHVIFDVSQAARTVVIIIGIVTLLLGCIIGCAYDDIKKVLAYSTVSQIGYMFLAAGLGPTAYAIAIIHLVAHGFFKANMFLGAGSVMHAMNDQVDMRRFGGLARVMPITAITFGVGYLAIIGIPPFSGFFSKDKIIEAAFDKGGTSGWIAGIAAVIGAGLTSFYMTRLMAMTFFGRRRWTEDVHPHEAGPTMTIPLILLAIGSAVAGGLMVFGASVQHWLSPSTGPSVEEGVHTISPVVLTLITLVVVLLGAAGGFVGFAQRPVPVVAPVGVSPVTVAARRNLYADAFNEAVIMRPGQWLTRALVYLDNRGVDGGVNGLAALIGGSSGRLRRIQTGFVRSYALSMLGGAVLLAGALLLVKAG